ncbi:hypothetical protein YPPY90_1491, partial [Yersinia pestis PY-90]
MHDNDGISSHTS